MADARTRWPSPPAEKQLAADLVAQVRPSTANDVAVAFLAPLTGYLQARYLRADPHDCETAAGTAAASTGGAATMSATMTATMSATAGQ